MWVQVVDVCDVVFGINLYEESRVAKGFPSLLGYELRSNGECQSMHCFERCTVSHLLMQSLCIYFVRSLLRCFCRLIS